MEEEPEKETEVDDDGFTIAERLRSLQKAMGHPDDDDEDEDEDDDDHDVDDDQEETTDLIPTATNNKGVVTTQSLSQLLEQALKGGDDTLLELALSSPTSDERLIEESVQSLSDASMAQLLMALTSRLATKPSRAEALIPWFTALLECSRDGSGGGIRSMRQWQALQNLLQERTSVFADLLQLDGRLSMMGGK